MGEGRKEGEKIEGMRQARRGKGVDRGNEESKGGRKEGRQARRGRGSRKEGKGSTRSAIVTIWLINM